MFGLEKKSHEFFEFDLEKEIKKSPEKGREILKLVETRIQEIKQILRQGAASDEFDRYGVLLQGFAALQKVITKTMNTKK